MLQAAPIQAESVRARFSKVLWDQIRPWAYLDETPVEIRDFAGNPLIVVTPETEGAEAIFWETRFIEPFIEDICVSEIHAVIVDARNKKISARSALRPLRVDLIKGITRIYWTMADIHRQIWKYPGWPRRDTSDEVDRMVAFIDATISAKTKSAG